MNQYKDKALLLVDYAAETSDMATARSQKIIQRADESLLLFEQHLMEYAEHVIVFVQLKRSAFCIITKVNSLPY